MSGTTNTVWVQLYLGDKEKKSGSSFEIEPLPRNVSALRNEVKKACDPKLNFCAPSDLDVYAPGAPVPIPDGGAPLDPGDSVPADTTSRTPLAVVAPAQNERHQQQQRQPPPNAPIPAFAATTPAISPPSEERFVELLDQLQLDLQIKNQRATPTLTPAHLGEAELTILRSSNRIRTFEESAGQPACLNAVEYGRLARCSAESEIVAFLTPIFELIFEHLAVVNSEEYSWLVVSSEKTARYNQRPDLLVCHGAIYKRCKASETTPPTESLRRPAFKFGVLSDWVLRDCISMILEAKAKISNASFGEVLNYGRHVSLHHPEPNDVRIVLFDKQEFWLVVFAGGVCAMVTQCQWTTGGSRNLLKSFAKTSTWMDVLDSVCEKLDLVVAEGGAFLGHGSFGRVFRVFRRGRSGARDALALKIVLGADSLDLRTEAGSLRQAFSLVPDHVVEVAAFEQVEDGAGLLLVDVGRSTLRCEVPAVMEALAALHAQKIYHGDPRLPNAIVVGGTVKWIDLRGSRFHPITTHEHFLHDMNILVCSILSVSSLAPFPLVEELVKKYAAGDISAQQLCTTVLQVSTY